MISLNNSWDDIIKDSFEKQYYQKLRKFLIKEYEEHNIYPDKIKIFEAFKLTDYDSVKVVIIGQDPYHGEKQAHGLAFSVNQGVDIPPSLLNIFKELNLDLGISIPDNGFLEKWAQQGVFLLNTVLTVRAHQANSHKNIGWEIFTDEVISKLSNREKPIVFLLWGKPAQQKEKLIDVNKHLVLKASHPSPLSAYRGFIGCKHFSLTNNFLKKNGIATIDWQL